MVVAFIISGARRGEAWSAWLTESRNALCREPSGARRSHHPRASSHVVNEVAEHDLHVLPYRIG